MAQENTEKKKVLYNPDGTSVEEKDDRSTQQGELSVKKKGIPSLGGGDAEPQSGQLSVKKKGIQSLGGESNVVLPQSVENVAVPPTQVAGTPNVTPVQSVQPVQQPQSVQGVQGVQPAQDVQSVQPEAQTMPAPPAVSYPQQETPDRAEEQNPNDVIRGYDGQNVGVAPEGIDAVNQSLSQTPAQESNVQGVQDVQGVQGAQQGSSAPRFQSDPAQREAFAAEVGSWKLNGNVDHLSRPIVSAQAMRDAGYTEFKDGDAATLYSSRYTFGGGRNKHSLVMTPISADGKVLSKEKLQQYVNYLLANGKTLDGIIALDKKKGGLLVGIDAPEGIEKRISQVHGKYYLGQMLPDEYGERAKLEFSRYGKRALRQEKARIEGEIKSSGGNDWDSARLKAIDQMLADPRIGEDPVVSNYGPSSTEEGDGNITTASNNGTTTVVSDNDTQGTGTPTATSKVDGNQTTTETKPTLSRRATSYRNKFLRRKYSARKLQAIIDRNKGKTDANSVAAVEAAQSILDGMSKPEVKNPNVTTNGTSSSNTGTSTTTTGNPSKVDDSSKTDVKNDGTTTPSGTNDVDITDPTIDYNELQWAEQGDDTRDVTYRSIRDERDEKEREYKARQDWWNDPENTLFKNSENELKESLKAEGLDAEGEERREKRRRRNRLIANIGDVLQGFANLAGVWHGATSQNLTSLSAAQGAGDREESKTRRKRRDQLIKNHEDKVAKIQKKADKELSDLYKEVISANERLNKYVDEKAKEQRRFENSKKLEDKRTAENAKREEKKTVERGKVIDKTLEAAEKKIKAQGRETRLNQANKGAVDQATARVRGAVQIKVKQTPSANSNRGGGGGRGGSHKTHSHKAKR